MTLIYVILQSPFPTQPIRPWGFESPSPNLLFPWGAAQNPATYVHTHYPSHLVHLHFCGFVPAKVCVSLVPNCENPRVDSKRKSVFLGEYAPECAALGKRDCVAASFLASKVIGFVSSSVLAFPYTGSPAHAVDALDFRGRSLVLRKDQRILVFLVLNPSGSAFLAI